MVVRIQWIFFFLCCIFFFFFFAKYETIEVKNKFKRKQKKCKCTISGSSWYIYREGSRIWYCLSNNKQTNEQINRDEYFTVLLCFSFFSSLWITYQERMKPTSLFFGRWKVKISIWFIIWLIYQYFFSSSFRIS